ncbi:MAG: hypothetical protein PHU06_06300 [Gallionella sp.]|nr:hypothetical protein [Gallionella sp.]MDD4958423.1 hypothetical protein [Gallionella sp.]
MAVSPNPPVYKFPKTTGACVDRLYKLQAERRLVDKQSEAMKAEEAALTEHLILTIPKSDATGVAGKLARCTVVKKIVPSVKDWDAFFEYVRKTKSFDLLQRRVSDKAVAERWDNGKTVPGVEQFNVVKLSMNKI